MNIWVAFGTSFLYVALRAFQQRNVQHDNYTLVLPTSLAMGAADVFLVAGIARAGFNWPLVLSYGLGAGLGCIFAMLFHKRYVLKR